jgi:hypothetical protein
VKTAASAFACTWATSRRRRAERLLELVREIYLAAWAGVAPGQRLRAVAAAGDGAECAPAPPVAESPPAPVAEPPPAAPLPIVRPADVTAAPEPALSAAAQSLHSVRAAIESLESGKASAAAAAVPPTVVMPELRGTGGATLAAVGAGAVAGDVDAGRVAADRPGAERQSGPTRAGGPAATPAPRNETAAYAVQLLWSVQPIDMGGVPQLAIFSAYTLYGAAGNRDGRRWYGLRLGFFTDAVSAKQVANYVRSEFASGSIVPVSARERDRALAAAPRAPMPEAGLVPKKAAVSIASSGEFRLLDEKPAVGKPVSQRCDAPDARRTWQTRQIAHATRRPGGRGCAEAPAASQPGGNARDPRCRRAQAPGRTR